MAKQKRKRAKRAKKQLEKPKIRSGFDDALFAWYAPEYIRYERSWKWYLLAGIVDALLIGYAVWTEAWSMALVLIVLAFVVVLELRRKPKLTTVVLSHWGIQFGDLEIPFADVKRFWIHHQPPHVDELRLQVQSRVHPEVIIPLNGANPSLIRHYLVTQIPEWEGKEMSLIDVIARILRLH